MFIFKSIDESDVSTTETVVHKQQSLHSGSNGITSVQYRSGSKIPSSDVTYDTSGSYWDSLHLLFYQSGSSLRASEASKYGQPGASLANRRSDNPTHITKFFPSGSILSIPQKYIGERIKPGTFKLIDNSTATTITIRDDNYGNLYPVDNTISNSTASPSSSDNYVGNIFYDLGVVTITDTGSYATGRSYTDATTDKYTLQFKSTQTIYTHEYTVTIQPREYNFTMNPTVRGFLTTIDLYDGYHSKTPYLSPNVTGSEWSPYITQIQLYSNNENVLNAFEDRNNIRETRKLYEPVILANLPRPIKIRDNMTMTFKIRLDI